MNLWNSRSQQGLDATASGEPSRETIPPLADTSPIANGVSKRKSETDNANAQPRKLPELFEPRGEQYREALIGELRPTTALESILVAELARHAAAMDFTASAEDNILRFAARNATAGQDMAKAESVESLFAAAVSSHVTERIERFGQQHRRGFYRALSQLQFLREQRQTAADVALEAMFSDEQACESYLIGRLQASPPTCPRCTQRKHHFLSSRRRFECAGCGAQFGPRAGTVMERSPLTLTTWFNAIQAVCADTQITVRDLSEQIGLKRLPTVRAMRQKILRAIESGEAERLLAGLHALQGGPAAPARGAPLFANSQPGQRLAGAAGAATESKTENVIKEIRISKTVT